MSDIALGLLGGSSDTMVVGGNRIVQIDLFTALDKRPKYCRYMPRPSLALFTSVCTCISTPQQLKHSIYNVQ